MTNPTSNFGWQMPTPTDLVTDLPADFEVFGQAVDTSMADLKGGTTGQILSKASNTNMDFTWITNDVGDITAVNVTAPITGGGTSGAVTIGVSAASTAAAGVVQLSDSTSTTSSVLASTPTATKSAYDLAAAAIPKSTVTTAGDIIFRNGSAPTRLGIGTAGQVLKVNSGATAPEWAAAGGASGLNFVTGTSFSAVSSVSLPTSTFTSTYRNYAIVISLTSASVSGGTAFNFRLRASGTDNTSANYSWARAFYYSSASGSTGNGSDTTFVMFESTNFARGEAIINLFAPELTERTQFTAAGYLDQSGNTVIGGNSSGTSTVTTSYDAITFYPSNGTITGRYEVYGYANS